MIKNFILGLLGIGFGIAAFFHQVGDIQEVSALKREGQPLLAQIDGASSSTKRGHTFYWLKVNYSVGGRPYKGGGDVSEAVYRKHTFGGFYSSGEIPIRYLPSNPSVMRIADPGLPADFQETSVFLWFFAAGMSLFGIYCIKMSITDFRSYQQKK
jgi:hypothetical protein